MVGSRGTVGGEDWLGGGHRSNGRGGLINIVEGLWDCEQRNEFYFATLRLIPRIFLR